MRRNSLRGVSKRRRVAGIEAGDSDDQFSERLIDPTDVIAEVYGGDVGKAVAPEVARAPEANGAWVRDRLSRLAVPVGASGGQAHGGPVAAFPSDKDCWPLLALRRTVLDGVQDVDPDDLAWLVGLGHDLIPLI
jgi:hypothetical protein